NADQAIGPMSVSFTAAATDADGLRIATGDVYGNVQVWDLSRPATKPSALYHPPGLPQLRPKMTLRFRDGGRTLLIGRNDAVRLWQFDEPGSVPTDFVHLGGKADLSEISPDGRTLLVATASPPGLSHSAFP